MDLRLGLRRLAQPFAVALLDRLDPDDPPVQRAVGMQLAHARAASIDASAPSTQITSRAP